MTYDDWKLESPEDARERLYGHRNDDNDDDNCQDSHWHGGHQDRLEDD